MTLLSSTKRAFKELPRAQFIDKDSSIADPVRYGPKMPVPFFAHDENINDEDLVHADTKQNLVDINHQVKCQVCSLNIDEFDPTLCLFVSGKLHKSLDEYMKDYFIEPDSDEVQAETNGGPVHMWCAKMSLQMCPHLKTDDPDHLVGWIDGRTAFQFMDEEGLAGLIVGDNTCTTAYKNDLITLAQLNEMVDAKRESEK